MLGKKNLIECKIKKMDVLKFTENINSEMCDYLLQLSDDDLLSSVYDFTQTYDENGKKWNANDYIKRVKIWLKTMKDNDYKKICNYKYSTTLQDKGRIYIRGQFGVQSLQIGRAHV